MGDLGVRSPNLQRCDLLPNYFGPCQRRRCDGNLQMCDYDVGEHCDVWGIGCIMYRMITGVPIHYSFRHEPHDEIPNKVTRFTSTFSLESSDTHTSWTALRLLSACDALIDFVRKMNGCDLRSANSQCRIFKGRRGSLPWRPTVLTKRLEKWKLESYNAPNHVLNVKKYPGGNTPGLVQSTGSCASDPGKG